MNGNTTAVQRMTNMSDHLSSKTALVFDNGLFVPIAHRLAQSFGRVLYHQPWETGFSVINQACVGDGYQDIERCEDIWHVKDEVDLWVFPDLGHDGLQLELERQGKRVWGARSGDRLELNRELFLKTLAEVGLTVPEYQVVEGLSKLRRHLLDKENLYIKISKYRGMMETTHWRSWREDSGLLDLWAVKWGPLAECVRWLVFDPIETDLEIGGDTYNVRGQWPNVMLHGIECKDEAYFGAVTERDKMPAQLQAVMDAFGPVLKEHGSVTSWSMEVRVKDDVATFIDPTIRGGLPSTASQLVLWENYPEIIWHGAAGELVEPEPAAKFSMEVSLKTKSPRKTWSVVVLPDELKPWVKLASCCRVNDADCFPPDDAEGEEIGWLVALGDTPAATLERMKELAALLPDGVCASTASLVDVIANIESEEKEGIEFTEHPLPDPAEVVETQA